MSRSLAYRCPAPRGGAHQWGHGHSTGPVWGALTATCVECGQLVRRVSSRSCHWFVERVAIPVSVMSEADHRAFGLQSNIPACCVEEWVSHLATERADHQHVWHVGLRRCIAVADCSYIAPVERMRQRGLPDVKCDYIPCLPCHVEIAAGVLTPNRLNECEYRAPSQRAVTEPPPLDPPQEDLSNG